MEPAKDPDTNFRFMEDSNLSVVEIRPADGLVTVREVIDRERICAESPRCLINFDIVVFHMEKYQLIQVEIEVKDINDHQPHFPLNETYIEISESVTVGTRFPLDIALDQDVGDNYIQKYQVSLNSHFSIEMHVRDDGVKHAELVLVKALDREEEDSYSLEVSASDGGNPPRSGSMTVHMKVLDFNDNSPAFEHNFHKVEVHEDAPVGFLVLRVRAFDPDDGVNGEVMYGFVKESSPEIKRVFQIDPFTGAVTLKAVVDYETRRSYELIIQAYDLGDNAVPSTCKVVVDVVDVNDNAPEIIIKPMTSITDGVAYISEAAAEESFVALIRTSDRDSASNGNVRVSLHEHEHFKLQKAYGGAFVIVTTTTLDREKIPEYNLTVIAEDLGSPPFKTIKQYTIRVSDENDNAPLFSKSIYEVSVIENNSPGSYITTVVARDLDEVRVRARDTDEGPNSELTFRILEDKSGLFAINKDSGEIILKHGLTFMCGVMLEIKISVSDNGRLPLSSGATVRFLVTDMEPSEDQIIVMQQSIDDEYLGLDMSVVVIIMLGGGCALLLIAIVTVAFSCKRDPKDRDDEGKKNVNPGLFETSSQNSRDSGCLLNEQTASSLDDSAFLYDERSGDSETKVFLPPMPFGSSSLCTKPFEPLPLWHGDKYTSQHSSSGSSDQLSVEDSGKGDSDFNDSGSDISEGCKQNARSSALPQGNGSICAASTLAAGQRSSQRIIPNHSAAPCRSGYTIAFSRTPVYSRALANPACWRSSGFGSQSVRAQGLPPTATAPRTATSPAHCQV
ncbi:hypothetical protein JZ751_006630 [Albula glossodonta]|uniref:Cadherin domain-containing protein n=1 Tax=Albula glossodonta TaxID=121402 RepID=A0A8T2P1X6_9TELE|nr:hypothetical protein JZ751_006630 [Albula glossodonta]